MTWLQTVGGKLKSDFRYSSALVYNTFPFPYISVSIQEKLTQHSFSIIEERELYPEKTLSQLYKPDKMPTGLKKAHRQNDLAVEKCYRQTPFTNDTERLEYLFSLYEKMIELEQSKNTFFADEVKKKRKRRINA